MKTRWCHVDSWRHLNRLSILFMLRLRDVSGAFIPPPSGGVGRGGVLRCGGRGEFGCSPDCLGTDFVEDVGPLSCGQVADQPPVFVFLLVTQ